MGSQPRLVAHAPPSAQTTLLPAHAPFAQVSLLVQASLSSHVALLKGCRQPLWALQTSVVQPFWSLQLLRAGTLPHTPLVQTAEPWNSKSLQLATEHALPSLRARCLQPPTPSQESVVQGLPSSHGLMAEPHLPPAQVSPLVQALPSLQVAPLAR